MPDSRKKGSMTKQQRILKRFTQLWLSAAEWEAPIAIIEEDGQAVSLKIPTDLKVRAWIVTRRRP